MRGELAVRIAKEVERLPDDQREAVRLRHLEGWSLAQLAQHFGRGESAVAGLIKRGLRALRCQYRHFRHTRFARVEQILSPAHYAHAQ